MLCLSFPLLFRTVIVSSRLVLLLISFIDSSPIVDNKMLWYMVCRHYCIVHWSVDIPSYKITEVVPFADMSHNPIHDESVFVCDLSEASLGVLS